MCIGDRGVLGGIRINDHRQYGFEMFTLPLDENQLGKIDYNLSLIHI